MNTLRDWHGDIEEFIDAKQKEEKKAWALIEQGYDGSYNGEAYGSVMYQNENLSVRASDEFMQAALDGKEWWTRSITSGKPLQKKEASQLLKKIAEGTWVCGDPGMQYDGAIQKWHTCKSTEPIHSTNPCSEYVFINNTACNLASLNLMKFKREDGAFNVERFKAAVRIFITAQEILVDNASYPTKEIAENSHIFRTLGLGYANLGSLIMSYGLPYDSDEARALAGALTAIMTGLEPDIALVKYKLLAGGGMLKIVNRMVPDALRRLGYSQQQIERIIGHIEKFDTIEDVEENGQTTESGLKPEHLEVFDCAFK